MILTVTGHRPPKLGGYRIPNPLYREVVAALRDHIDRLKPEVVLTGMALGTDQWVAQICLDMGVPFDCVIPYSDFGSNWPQQTQQAYHYLRGQSRTVVDVEGLTHPIQRSRNRTWGQKLYARNAWMVQHCDHVLALWNESPGGTANCVNFARSHGKPVSFVGMQPRFWQEAAVVENDMAVRKAQRNGRIAQMLEGSAPLQEFVQRTAGVDFARDMDRTIIDHLIAPSVDAHTRVDASELNQTYQDIRANIERAMGQDFGYSSNQLEVRLPRPLDYIPLTMVTGGTEVPPALQAPRETLPEQKEKISAGDGFKPRRLIDLDD